MSLKVHIRAHFDKGYIGHPYWPEREKLINIIKESGSSRVRSEERRSRALDEYLKAHNLTMEDYHRLETLADRPFHMLDGQIIIPAHHVHGCFAQASALCSSSIRIARSEQIRTVLQSSDWTTGKAKGDGVWERFVVVKSGTGQNLSNQRALRSNEYIEDFDAEGTLTFVLDRERLPKLQDFIRFAGADIGVGGSRKLGWGRFDVTDFAVVEAPA